MILAIDPGPEQSAYVMWRDGRIYDFGKCENAEVRLLCDKRSVQPDECCVIEMIASYGMPVGAEVFETCVWIGRFMEAFGPERCDRITRGEVKIHICHSRKAKDSNVRQALIDRFGGKARAIGKKSTPGPLYGVKQDVWAALAVAVTWSDRQDFARRIAEAEARG